MVDLIHFNGQLLQHVMVDQLKVLMADPVLHVPLPAHEEVVHHGHFVTSTMSYYVNFFFDYGIFY